MRKILVTGAGGPAGINFVNSIRIAPERISVVGTEANQYLVHLAPTDSIHVIPRASRPGYIDELNNVISEEHVEFVHPQPDVEVAAISENREKVKAAVFLPSKDTVRRCQDKLESAKIWEKNNIPMAKAIPLTKESDVAKAFEILGNPIWIRARRGAGGKGSTPAYNVTTATSWINYWKARGVSWEFMAQTHLPGRNIGFHSLWKNGELVTSMARERIEYMYPYLAPSGITGTPTVQRTIHDDRINKISTEAILSIDPEFNGIACLDLKEDEKGLPCVTEINAGRMFTTSFFLSYASKTICGNYYGNFPYVYTMVAFKERIPDIPRYNILPKDIYWIRHIDAPAKLVRDGKIIGEMHT
jgi:carbamoyl-phosphate synthase large subunit